MFTRIETFRRHFYLSILYIRVLTAPKYISHNYPEGASTDTARSICTTACACIENAYPKFCTMVSTAGTTVASDATSDAPSRPRNDGQRGHRGRGRGRSRGGPAGEHSADFRHSDHRGGRRGRGGHRGGLSNHETSPSNTIPAAEAAAMLSTQKKVQPPTGPESGKAVGGKDNEDEDEEVCFICAASIEHNAVAPCNHRTCHICALRMRALYKTKDCPHCRVGPTKFPSS